LPKFYHNLAEKLMYPSL